MRGLHDAPAVLLWLGGPLAIGFWAWGVDGIVGRTEDQVQQRLEFTIREAKEQRAAAPPTAALPDHMPDHDQQGPARPPRDPYLDDGFHEERLVQEKADATAGHVEEMGWPPAAPGAAGFHLHGQAVGYAVADRVPPVQAGPPGWAFFVHGTSGSWTNWGNSTSSTAAGA
jgi:hypothetical protein